MLKHLFTWILFICIMPCAYAAGQAKQDKIYLKSGAILEGKVIGQEAGKTVTFETLDGKTHIVDVGDIKRTVRHAADRVTIKPEKIDLKSGEVLEGVITGQEAGKTVTMETLGGETRVIDIADIDRVARHVEKNYKGMGPKRGYHAFAEFSTVVDPGAYGAGTEPRIVLRTTHGYQLNHWLFAGAGLGLQYYYTGYKWSSDPFVIVPLYADLRFTPLNHKFTPVVDFKGGYAVGKYHGYYIHPSAGCRLAINNNVGVTISVGYIFQSIDNDKIQYRGLMVDPKRHDWLKTKLDGLSISIGVDF